MTPIKAVSEQARRALQEFLSLESSGGILLAAAAALALLLANSPLAQTYEGILATHLTMTLGDFGVDKPLLLWINDGLMAVFFLLIGLEVKREMVQGQLSSPGQVVLPAVAAAGGLLVPAAVYLVMTRGVPEAAGGWAIPTATDIAFALAILTLLGPRVPTGLKVFLATIAIIDDLAAIIIIAVFYSSDLSLLSMLLALAGIAALILLNRRGVTRTAPYLWIGLLIWLFVLKSGVHATLAGVAVAACIPLRGGEGHSPAQRLEHELHPWVAYGVLPVFAFANAGIALGAAGAHTWLSSTTMAIAAGLFVGKQAGVFGMTALCVGLGWSKKPTGTGWWHLYGAALLCGVGFTMSLFIGSLAFEHGDMQQISAVKLGVILGSLASALLGWLVLRATLPRSPA
jgi:NhaA family Na+:H+ antiporter